MRNKSWKHDPSPGKRIVTRTPIDELWGEAGPLAATRERALGADELWALLRQGSAWLVVACVGKALRWLPERVGYEFWKSELRAHLADPGRAGAAPDEFPGGYCYFASEWRLQGGDTVVLLEMAR